MGYFVGLIVAALLGLIPANIAKKKGHSFGLWWFYGWMLFIVAIIHVNFIPDYTAQENTTSKSNIIPKTSVADEIKKYKELLDAGAITQDEFESKKGELLNSGSTSPASKA